MNEQRLMRVEIDASLVAGMLETREVDSERFHLQCLPKGAALVRADMPTYRDVLELVFFHPSFDVIPEGGLIPLLRAVVTKPGAGPADPPVIILVGS